MLQLEVTVSTIMLQETIACFSECRTACHPATQDEGLLSWIRHVQQLHGPVTKKQQRFTGVLDKSSCQSSLHASVYNKL